MANKNLYVLIFVIAQLLLYVQARCQSDYVPFYTPNGLFDRIFDRFGNEYYLDDIRIRPGINGMSLEPCQAGYFNLWIEEDSGFYGLENTTRRETLCRVFSDLSNFIIPVNVSNLVDIRVYGNSDSDYLGSATQYHQEYAPASGITKGTVWHSINSGINSMGGGPLDNLFGINFFKGGLTIDWDHLWNENFNEAPNPNEFDLYSVILHEVTHLLGFASLIRLNGEGLQTYLQNFYYSSYDTFLHTNTNIQLITNVGCTLYEHQFNPLLNSQLLLAPGTGLPCPDSAPNNTDCSTAVRYFGNVNQSLYTGACHSQGSTLSHFADDCYTIQPGFNEPAPFPTLNQYYVMSIATPPGIIKRFLRPEERMTLCDLGYHVSTTFGSIESLNFYDYFEEDGDVTCNINPTAGLNDGIENNQYLWINTLQTPFNFLGSDILQNDINADEFLCLEIISGEGTLSATSGSNETVVSVVALSAGIIVFRYVPYNSITGKYGNITYGYFYILDQTCYTPCSIIPNGEFENYYTNCGFPLSNKSHCWNELTSSNLSSIYLGPNCSSADILGFWNSEPFVYDNSDISNDHCIGIQSISGNSGVIQNLLTEPLITGETYQFQYWAKVSPLSPVDELSLEIGFSEYLLLSIGDLEEAQIIYPFATVNVANDGLWHFITVPDFVYQGPEGYQNFVLSLTTSNELGSGISGFLLVDGISLKKTTTDVHFSSIANELVVGETIHNLENSVNISGGVFSGNGVNCMDGACSFNSGIAGIGVHTLSYTIIDANGCPCSTYHVVIVNAGVSIESDTNPICTVPGEPVTLIASGAITYSWTPVEGLNITSGPIVVATPLVTTTYTVQGVNEFGITSTSTITVVPQLPFELSYTLDPGNTLCEVNSSDINLSLFGAYTYSVNPINSWEEITEGNFQIQANEIELYSDYELIGYSQEGCTAMELLAFELNPEIIISETISFDNCESSADIDITLSGGTEPFSINWGNLPIDFDPLLEDQNNLTSGNYTVQIEDSNNCINLATFEIETFSEITANFMVNSPICPETNNGEISISELSGGCDGTILFNWTGPNGYTSSNQNIANLSSGLYHVSIEDTNCSCISIYDIEVPAANWDEPNNLLINTEEQVNNWTGNTISFGGNITFASDFATIIGNNDVETTFILSSSSHIIIDEGSNISFVNCVFTSCGNHWKGFEILSDALFDNEDPSGQLTLLNCSISYAEIAIFTTDGFPLLEEVLIIDSEGNVTSELVPVYEGGIISATNTSFLNNLRSVKIRQSIRWAQDTPETSFTNCSFIVNDGLADHFFDIDYTLPWNSFKSHVSYDEVIGYSFINCTFENNFVNLANQGGWGGWGCHGFRDKKFQFSFRSEH
jgi:hypothetical protein